MYWGFLVVYPKKTPPPISTHLPVRGCSAPLPLRVVKQIALSPPSICSRRVVNIFFAMTRTNWISRLVCLSVIMTFCFALVRPAFADEDEEEDVDDTEYKDPTIVTDDVTSTPDGVKDLIKKYEKKTITNPVYEKWWFWATAIGAVGAWVAFSVIPFHKRAPTCGPEYKLGCVGDGR